MRLLLRTLLLLCLASAPMHAAPITIDRVLLKVNDSTYTQRELEAYFLVKAVKTGQGEAMVSIRNWREVLEIFKVDMLAYEETFKLRYASYSKVGKAAVEKTRAFIMASKELNELSQRLVLSDRDIEQSLIMLERIQKYNRDNKDQKETVESLGIPQQRRVSLEEKRNFVRYFDDAYEYKFIQPSAYTAAKK